MCQVAMPSMQQQLPKLHCGGCVQAAASAQAEQDAIRDSELVMIGGPLHSAKTMRTDLGVRLLLPCT